MISETNIKLFLVDDDAVFLKALEFDFLQLPGFTVETFKTGELCVESLDRHPGVIILDYHLDGIDKGVMNGMQTLDKITSFDPAIPVIMLSSQDKIEVAVSCMHHGAFDYVVKSETAFMRLQKTISLCLRYNKMQKELKWYMDRT